MHSQRFRSIFVGALKFLQIKERRSNFWGEPILQKALIIWSPLLYFNFKSFLDPNSSSFIRFQWILHDSGVLFSVYSNFYKLKRWGSNSCRQPILQNVWVIWFSLLYLKFESFLDPESSSFIRFQQILYDSGVPFSDSSNLYKL